MFYISLMWPCLRISERSILLTHNDGIPAHTGPFRSLGSTSLAYPAGGVFTFWDYDVPRTSTVQTYELGKS
jgi:hypothetical protein